MVPHRYTTKKGKSCPGNYLFARYGAIADEVNRRLKGEDEDVDINKMLQHIVTLPEPEWSQKEGAWKKAQETGVMDGTSPERPLKRDEFAAVLDRKGLL